MDTIVCQKGCCQLKILPKTKVENCGTFQPFEKRKAGVFIKCQNKILLTQSYNNCWGIPKGQMESFDLDTKMCAIREVKEETGLNITLKDTDLFKVVLDNCYIYTKEIKNMDDVNSENLANLDSTGIGWVDPECASDFNLNFLTKKILMMTFSP